jgi:hypothetical protein
MANLSWRKGWYQLIDNTIGDVIGYSQKEVMPEFIKRMEQLHRKKK